MNMHFAQLCAAVKFRKHFSWVQAVSRVECTFYSFLLVQVIFCEHGWHEIAFLNAYTMLASQCAANLNAKP